MEQVMGTVEPELDALEKELAGGTPEEPHPFVALLLARMESSPEEFGPDNGPWRVMVDQSKQYLTAEEKKLLKAAEREVGLRYLHAKMMQKLLAGKAPSYLPATDNSTTLGMGTATTLGTYALRNTNTVYVGSQRLSACGRHVEVYDGHKWMRFVTVDPNDE
jgi:hypothetical protein